MKRVERGDASAGRTSVRGRGAGAATRANEGTNGLSAPRSRRASDAALAAESRLADGVRTAEADEVGACAESGDGASLRAAIGGVATDPVVSIAARSKSIRAAPGAAADGAACACGGIVDDAGSFAANAAATLLSFVSDAARARGAGGAASFVRVLRLRGAFGVALEVASVAAALARLRGVFATVAGSSAFLRGPARVEDVDSPSALRVPRLRGAGLSLSSMRESVAVSAR